LLGGKVGEEEGARDDRESEATAAEEEAFGTGVFVFTGEPKGEASRESGEDDEGEDGGGVHCMKSCRSFGVFYR